MVDDARLRSKLSAIGVSARYIGEKISKEIAEFAGMTGIVIVHGGSHEIVELLNLAAIVLVDRDPTLVSVGKLFETVRSAYKDSSKSDILKQYALRPRWAGIEYFDNDALLMFEDKYAASIRKWFHEYVQSRALAGKTTVLGVDTELVEERRYEAFVPITIAKLTQQRVVAASDYV